jgi:hypothetical protein
MSLLKEIKSNLKNMVFIIRMLYLHMITIETLKKITPKAIQILYA